MISDSDFSLKMEALRGNKKISRMAVAVSGGADSLCLTLLADRWARAHEIELYALTVDHGLRAESAEEAEFVHEILTKKGISHTTLVWKGKKPKTRVEEIAREERYRLLSDWCQKNDTNVLLIAHHQDDQAETFLQRLARSSGVDGLSAIQPKSMRGAIELWRPLLDFPRVEIQKTMRESFHQAWVEDPSNQNTEYERVRLRQFQKELDKIGLTTDVVALSAKRLARVRQALEQVVDEFWKSYVLCHSGGFIFIDIRDFKRLPQEIALRILAKAFTYISGNEARLSQLEALLNDMPQRATLCDCLFVYNKQGIYVCEEYAKMPPQKEIKKNKPVVWGRFNVVCDADVIVAPLGTALRVKGLPSLVSKTIPAFFDKKGLAFIPALDYKQEKTDIKGTIQIKE